MEIKRDEIYNNLKILEIMLEKSLSVIPFCLSVVKVHEVNEVLKQIYDCLPDELKKQECRVYSLLKQFEFALNNSFPILPNYLVAAKINILEKIIDQIYAILPTEFAFTENLIPVGEKCTIQSQPQIEMKLLIFVGQIIKNLGQIIPIAIVGIIIVYIFGIDKFHSVLLGIINNISK